MDLIIFIIGIVLGIAAMLFLRLLERAHSVFHEIDWHDASRETPTLYEHAKNGYRCIDVIIYDDGDFIVCSYYPDDKMYNYIGGEISFFAYVEELKRTIPPCPVCSGVDINNPISHYANPSVL